VDDPRARLELYRKQIRQRLWSALILYADHHRSPGSLNHGVSGPPPAMVVGPGSAGVTPIV
jgi:hypothetical protein